MKDVVLKRDIDVTWRAELKSEGNALIEFFEGRRCVVENHLKQWIAIMIDGDTITLNKIEK